MERFVSELRYRAVGTSSFDDPPPVTVTNSFGVFALADDLLHVSLADERGSVRSARETIEPFLRAWELEAEIRWGFPVISFEFQSVEIVKRPGQQAILRPQSSHSPKDDSSSGIVISFSSYPPPPSIRVTPEMEDLWSRYKTGQFDLREPFQSAAYYCLTLIERSAGGRTAAARKYNVDVAILRKLGELTSTRGDASTARKALSEQASALSHEDRKWISYAIRSIMLQMGLVASGTLPSQLALSDLPRISPENA